MVISWTGDGVLQSTASLAAPNWQDVGGNDLLITNLTGHPTLVLPNGFDKRGDAEMPTSLTFTGRLYGEAELLAVGHAYQQATGFHLRRPPLDKLAKAGLEAK